MQAEVAGDERSDGTFDETYRQLRPALLRLAYLFVDSTTEAEEVVQDALVTYWRRRSSVEFPLAYLRRVVVRSSLRVTRRRRRDGDAHRTAASREPPAADFSEDHALWEAVERLPPNQRAVIVLRYYLDLPHESIAQTLGVRVATVRTRVHRALSTLRQQLEDPA